MARSKEFLDELIRSQENIVRKAERNYNWFFPNSSNHYWTSPWEKRALADLEGKKSTLAALQKERDSITPVNNKELWKAIPHFNNYDSNPNHINSNNSILKQVDKQWTIDNLKNLMEQMILHEDYMKSVDRNYRTSKEEDEEFNRYKKTLKGLWVSFDEFRNRYYSKHPTPEMQAWDKAWEMMNDRFYNTLWQSPSQLKQEEQKLQDVINNSPNDFVKKSALDKLDANRAKQKSLQRTWKKFRYSKPDNRVVL